jgi:hypothetical protein
MIAPFGAPRDRDELARLEELGIDGVVYWIAPAQRDAVERELDEIAGLVAA